MMKKVILITSGFSSFVSGMIECNQFLIGGILDCQSSAELKMFAEKHGIPYRELKEQNIQLIQWIQKKKPEVMAVFKMPFLLKKEIFSLPKYGTLNLHPSLLPKYRGPNPWFWVYYNMEKESGVTIHFIDEGEDTGNIIYQESFNISIGEKLENLKEKATKIGTKLMIETLCNIEHIQSIRQPVSSPTIRARNISDYNNLIDWRNWSVERIWHIINSFPEILQANESYRCEYNKIVNHEDIPLPKRLSSNR